MINWRKISDDEGFGTIKANMPVLLVAKYPGSDNWCDPVYGWRQRPLDNPNHEYARWKHDFPPTHYALVEYPSN